MDSNPCTAGAIKKVFSSNVPADQACPNAVVQVLQIKSLSKPGQPDRYRVVLSDSQNFVQAMFASQANKYIEEEKIVKNSIIRLKSYQANRVKDKKIIIAVDVEPLTEYKTPEKLGAPMSMDGEGAELNGAATPAQQPVQQANAGDFYAPKPAPAPAPRAAATGASRQVSRPSGSAQHANIYPIEAISPYQNKWTIRARVTNKSDRKEWNNGRTEGRLFTVNFLDETGEIRATAFNDECDKFFDELEDGHVYYVSKARVVMAKKQFSNVNNDYELTFNRDTEVERCDDQEEAVPMNRFNFVPISEIANVDKDATVDVLGVVKDVGEVSQITSKTTQKPYQKRDISIVDNSETMIRMTVWGDTALNWELEPNHVVAFKGVKVSDFGGRSLSMLFSSTMVPNPDIDEAHALKGWYDSQGMSKDLSTYADHSALAGMGPATGRVEVYKTLAQVKDEGLGQNEDPDYFNTKATITYIKHENISYPACLTANCNKKVVQVNDEWHCAKCDTMHPKPQYRYILTLSCCDAFGQAWLSAFDDVGRLVMGKPADEMQELAEDMSEGAKQAYEQVFTDALCQTFNFRVRAKMDTYEGNQRVRYQVMTARPLDYSAECKKLEEQIKAYNQD